MKQRMRLGFAGAASKILKALGRKTVGQIVGRSPSLVYKWSDPKLLNSPTVMQALEMDAEFVRGGYGPPPFLTTYGALLDGQLQEQGPMPSAQFGSETIRLLEEVVALVRASQPVQGGHYPGVSEPEAAAYNVALNLRRCREIIAGLAWTLENTQPE